MSLIPKPQNRENIIMFGDGDEAVGFMVRKSIEKGYLYFFLKPLEKMRWKKQIQLSEYERDGWVKKIYKEDLCFLLDSHPDFSIWFILCDYHGNEDTPSFKFYNTSKVMCPNCQHNVFFDLSVSHLILKNRSLDKEIKNLRLELNKRRIRERRMIEHPEEEWIKKKEDIKDLRHAFSEPRIVLPQQSSQYPELGSED